MKISQIFCRHIWKDSHVEVLSSEPVKNWLINPRYILGDNAYKANAIENVYEAVYKKCIKCEKIKIVERTRTNVLNEKKLKELG